MGDNSEMNGKKKKAILDNLYYNVGKQKYDFKVCGLIKKDGEIIPTKWKKFSEAVFPIDFDGTCEDWKAQKFFENINQREVFPNEIVLDLENKKQLKPTEKELKELGWFYVLYSTGSRGFHLHLRFKKEVSEKDIERIIKYFSADVQVTPGHMIALENYPHFKTGNLKEEIEDGN